MKLICMRGYPASSKTTLAKAVVADGSAARVSRDDLRASLFVGVQGVGTPEQENTVTRVIEAQAAALLKAGTSVVVDNTNLRLKDLKRWAEIAHKHGAAFEVFDVPTDVETCVARDKARGEAGGREVGEAVIRNFAQRFPTKNWPKVESTAPAQVKQYTGTPKKPNAIIVDIDGTLAKMVDRGPHDTSRYHTDEPFEAVHYAVDALGQDSHIVITSGRSEDSRDATEQWLWDHNVHYETLIMRKSGDVRNDAIVKEELFWEYIAPNFNVIFSLDDRDRVVDKWRAMGIPCFQVNYGDF